MKAKKTRLGLELEGRRRAHLTRRARPPTRKSTRASLERAITIMRKRVDALGVAAAGNPAKRLRRNRRGAAERLKRRPRRSAGRQDGIGLYFYDWEPNVIGPDGKPAPTEASVTGGENVASSTSGLLEYQAVLRAAKRRDSSARATRR